MRVGTLPGPPVVTVDILTVEYAATDAEASSREHYQMPLSHYAEEQGRINHAYIGPHYDEELGEVHTYDAVHDREAMQVYLQTFATTAPGAPQQYGGLTFHRLAGHDLDTDVHSTLFSGEQSNSSVAFGEDSLLKVFRRVTPGRNPDIEIHRALTEAESTDVAALYGWIEHADSSELWDLGMLQQFLRTASDGWDLALASARNLFAEADLHADEVGGDFAGEAYRLGVTVAEIHELLRRHFGTSPFDAKNTAEAMRDRLESVTAVVPELAAHAPPSTACSPRVAEAEGAPEAQQSPSACTATSTSARRCAPRSAGSWSTSRASRSSRSRSAGFPTRRGATSPACCAPSTTPPSRSSRTCTRPSSPARRSSTAPTSGPPATARPSSRGTSSSAR